MSAKGNHRGGTIGNRGRPMWPSHPEQVVRRKAIVIARLREGESPYSAAKAADVSYGCIYDWRRADEEFAKAWADAIEEGTDGLEDEAIRRAKAGSDTLLIFMLKARRKEVYAELHQLRHGGRNGGPIEIKDVTEDSRPALDVLFSEFAAEREETKH